MKGNSDNKIVKSKINSWMTPIYTFFVVVVPGMMIWLLFSSDFGLATNEPPLWLKFLIALGFISFVSILTMFLICIRLLKISVLWFAIPISIIFMGIFLTNPLLPWVRALICLPLVLLFLPIKILSEKIEMKIFIKNKLKKETKEEKIIGHK